MIFHSLIPEIKGDNAALTAEYQHARSFGTVRAGGDNLFFRAGLRRYNIPYAGIRRVFRRVLSVPIHYGKKDNDIRVESVVICGDKGELAQLRLPGRKPTLELMSFLQERLPGVPFGKPSEEEKAPEAAEKE
ncbi:MAG: hypothetical protein K6G17_06575 [Oscillospiraceae bacterium]|nr:hypothetical protein [Oscillospiraceae bacterium]